MTQVIDFIGGEYRNRTGVHGFAIRYLNPNARQEVADRDYAMMARGVDKSGNFIHYLPPTELFSAQSVALYDEIRIEQAKALTQDAKADVGLYQGNPGVTQ